MRERGSLHCVDVELCGLCVYTCTFIVFVSIFGLWIQLLDSRTPLTKLNTHTHTRHAFSSHPAWLCFMYSMHTYIHCMLAITNFSHVSMPWSCSSSLPYQSTDIKINFIHFCCLYTYTHTHTHTLTVYRVWSIHSRLMIVSALWWSMWMAGSCSSISPERGFSLRREQGSMEERSPWQ